MSERNGCWKAVAVVASASTSTASEADSFSVDIMIWRISTVTWRHYVFRLRLPTFSVSSVIKLFYFISFLFLCSIHKRKRKIPIIIVRFPLFYNSTAFPSSEITVENISFSYFASSCSCGMSRWLLSWNKWMMMMRRKRKMTSMGNLRSYR